MDALPESDRPDSEALSRFPIAGDAADKGDGLRLIEFAARMLLEYNVRSSILVLQINRLAARLGLNVRPLVSYRAIALHLGDGRTVAVEVPEYRINVARSSGVLHVIDLVCVEDLAPGEAIERMRSLDRAEPCHARWALAAMFGLAAAALACILHADLGTIIVSGLVSVLGLLVRQELGRRHWPLFSLPFVAGIIGGALGGLAIRLGWTKTPGLCLMIPGLMLVPGPHLINGLFEIFENQIRSGTCRLVLAVAILIATAGGILLGGWVVMGLQNLTGATSDALQLTLCLDVMLAGIAACGFGAFYNAPWRVLWISVVCGMVGHGVRFLFLAAGTGLPGSTLMACMAIGLVANIAVLCLHLPFSSVAFAGAVPMMPGTLIYRGFARAVQLSVAGNTAVPAQATAMLVILQQACLVVGAMAAGLLAGAFLASFGRNCIRYWRTHGLNVTN